jgi:outer membrane lipoprotein-sorting protein
MRVPSIFLIGLLMATPVLAEDVVNLNMDGTTAEKPAQNKAEVAPQGNHEQEPATSSGKAQVLTPTDKKEIARVEAYLGAIQTVSAKFSQVSPDGGVSNGKFYLQRPGKLRMEYDPPVPVLVITKDGNMVYYDKELDQVTHVPLSSTLVGFLARDRIRFDNTVIITNFEHGPQSLRITVVQSEKPKDGSMTLELSDKPLSLRNIIMTDSGDQTTTVSLADAHFDEKLDPSLFVFKDPHLGGKGHFKR